MPARSGRRGSWAGRGPGSAGTQVLQIRPPVEGLASPPLEPGGGSHNMIIQRHSVGLYAVDTSNYLVIMDHVVVIRAHATKSERHGMT